MENKTKVDLVLTRRNQDYAKYVAESILSQMQQPNIYVFFSWGAEGFQYGVNANENAFLTFKVNGNKFIGRVWVILDFSDTYNILFIKNNKLVQEYSDIYCDELQERIDEVVEDPSLY